MKFSSFDASQLLDFDDPTEMGDLCGFPALLQLLFEFLFQLPPPAPLPAAAAAHSSGAAHRIALRWLAGSLMQPPPAVQVWVCGAAVDQLRVAGGPVHPQSA